MKTTKIKVEKIQVGDVIMPPERELQLWMRKHAAEHGLSEHALTLTVMEIEDDRPDKGGPWKRIRTQHDPEWKNGHPYSFKARPWKDWKLVRGLNENPPRRVKVGEEYYQAKLTDEQADRIVAEEIDAAIAKEMQRLRYTALDVKAMFPGLDGLPLYEMLLGAEPAETEIQELAAQLTAENRQLKADRTLQVEMAKVIHGMGQKSGWVDTHQLYLAIQAAGGWEKPAANCEVTTGPDGSDER